MKASPRGLFKVGHRQGRLSNEKEETVEGKLTAVTMAVSVRKKQKYREQKSHMAASPLVITLDKT